jgi:hypothetical protein
MLKLSLRGGSHMWSRVVTAKIAPSNLDEAIRIWRDSVVPLNKQQKGWVSGRMLVDRKTGKAVVVAIWQTEAALKATSGPYLKAQFDKFATLFVEPPVEELYEVAAEG